jgi:hypothetical protein
MKQGYRLSGAFTIRKFLGFDRFVAGFAGTGGADFAQPV